VTSDTGAVWSFEPSPDGSRMLLTADGSGRRQPWLVPLDGSAAQLIELDGSVQRCVWHPDGQRFIALVDPDGHEDNQLFLVHLGTGAGTAEPITAQPGIRTELGVPYSTASDPVSPDGRWLAFATNRRVADAFDIVIRDLDTEAERTVLAAGDQVRADRYFPLTFSWDSRRLLVLRLHQNTETDLYAVDLASGQVSLLTEHEGPAKYHGVAWQPEGIYLCATYQGDFTGLALRTDDGELHWIDTPAHDIDCAVLSADGSTLAWAVNQDGFTELRTCSTKTGPTGTGPTGTGQHGPVAQLTGLPRGCYTCEHCADGHGLQLSADGGTLFAVDGTGALWSASTTEPSPTEPSPTETSARRLAGPSPVIVPPQPDVVRFTSTSTGTKTSTVTSTGAGQIPALLYRPPGAGPFPVLLNIHGGPEAQSLPVLDSLTEGLLARGIAVLATNIRGSSGYGLRYQRLIYRDWGGGDIADLRAAAEFIRTQPWADQDRLGVLGGSYGGFAALSCLTRLPQYWRAGAAICAVSDLVANVQSFPPTWRRRSKDWVGDVDDPADLRRLRQASPITHAAGLRAPLLLVHGTNDARVSIESCDALYARLTELGKDVTYKRIDGAGHDIGQQEPGVETMICDWLATALTNTALMNTA